MKILLIEDNPEYAQFLSDLLRQADKALRLALEIIHVKRVAAGLERLDSGDIDIILLDLSLPDANGLEGIKKIRARAPKPPIVVLTATDDEALAVRAIQEGAQDYLVKSPLKTDALLRVMRHAIERNELQTRLLQSSDSLRERAEDKLKQSEETFRLIAENVVDLIAIVGLDGTRLYNSPSYKKLLGDTELSQGTNSFQDIHPDDREKVRAAFEEAVKTGKGRSISYRFIDNEGNTRFIESIGSLIREDGKPSKLLIVSRDITERRLLQEQLQQSQKMEAIGRLAGGVAHDFNNLLMAILGGSELLLRAIGERDPIRKDIQEIAEAGRRAAELTRRLLAFSRKQVLNPKVLDLNSVVTGMEGMLRRLIDKNIGFDIRCQPDLGHIRVDKIQLEQVIMNLALNARDAMPKGGKLFIETSNANLDTEYARTHADAQPGPYVMLSIRDSGMGMDKDTLSHLFEPFFTTKEKGKGTGLGLSTVYGIVRQSGGIVSVESALDQGSCFKIYFPRVLADLENTSPDIKTGAVLHGSETILLVEDEEAVRNLMRRMLAGMGYAVLEAGDPKEAIALNDQYKGRIDLLVTDIVMPHMNGRELASLISSSRPGMKVLYISGYSEDVLSHQGVSAPDAEFVQKPIAAETLLGKIRDLLDRNS